MVHKVFAGRDRDWADVEGIVFRQGPGLDVQAIVAELSPLLELKSDVEGLGRFQRLLR